MDNNTLIGKRIKYSHSQDMMKDGIVLEKVRMFEQRKIKNSDIEKTTMPVTGFMIVDNEGKIDSVAYWRVKEVVDA